MRELTAFELAFVLEYRKNGFCGSKAYRTCRPHVTAGTAKVEASRVLRKPYIQTALGNLTEKVVESAIPSVTTGDHLSASLMSKEALIYETQDIMRLAKSKEKFASALKGVELTGRLLGMFDTTEDDMQMYREARARLSVRTVNIQQNVQVNNGVKMEELAVSPIPGLAPLLADPDKGEGVP